MSDILTTFRYRNPINYGYNPTRTYSWDIDLETELKAFYGWGYGSEFYDIESVGAPDYFHVIGVSGSSSGYGILNTKGDVLDEYFSGWGYEFAPAVISDNQDETEITATVTENGVPVSNVRVVFQSTAGTRLSVNSGITDENGVLKTKVKIDGSKKDIKIIDSEDGLVNSFEQISGLPNLVMRGNHENPEDIPDFQWIVFLPRGKKPELYGLPNAETSDLSEYRITLTDPGKNYVTTKVQPLELVQYTNSVNDLNDQWALIFESEFVYPVLENGEESEAVVVSGTTLQIYKTNLGKQKVSSLPINGWLQVRAYIDERPQDNEKKITIKSNATQNDIENAYFELTFNSYAYQIFNNYSYA